MAATVILLDTHALLWWAMDPEQLSPRAARSCERMEQEGGFASAISIWELGIKIARGKLDLGISIEEFTRRLQLSAVVELIPVDATVWLTTLSLPWAHRDPADRVIVATAALQNVPILTKDQLLHDYGDIETVW